MQEIWLIILLVCPLGILLLSPGNVPREILYGGIIFTSEAVGLGLEAGLLDEDAGVGREAGECEGDVRVEGHYFANGSWVVLGVFSVG